LRPNPEEFPNLAAVLLNDNHCKIVDITNGSTTCEFPVDDATAICWSPKGKQVVCGKLDGSLQHFDIHGASKDSLPIPQAMSAGNGEEKENRRGNI
jgi:WD40 repeat protein